MTNALLMPPQADFEERARVLGKTVFDEIDVSFRRSEAPPRAVVVEIASVVPKSGKTTQCQKLSSSLRAVMGKGLSVQVMQEPWEDPAIRAMRKGDADKLLGRYQSQILANYFDLLDSRVHHVGILDRSILDLFIQEEFFARRRVTSREHRDSVWASLLSAEWLKDIDAIFYLFADVDTSLAREKRGVSLERVGSIMNREALELFIQSAEATISELEIRAPFLKIFRMDTSHATEEETNARITLLLLEHLKERLSIDDRHVVPYSLAMMRSETARRGKLQVQIKLCGHPALTRIEESDWKFREEVAQTDTYLIFLGGVHPEIQPGEIIRIREANGEYAFAYKGVGVENTVTRRPHLNIPIDARQVQGLYDIYSKFAVVTKSPRRMYEQTIDAAIGREGKMYLCVDSIAELGSFTELSLYAHEYQSARKLLLEEAKRLGFGFPDIMEGNYLKMVTEKKL